MLISISSALVLLLRGRFGPAARDVKCVTHDDVPGAPLAGLKLTSGQNDFDVLHIRMRHCAVDAGCSTPTGTADSQRTTSSSLAKTSR